MTPASDFLASLGRALSGAALYGPGHPSLQRAVDAAWMDLQPLMSPGRPVTFTFLGETVLFGDLPLDDRRRFEWSARLAEAGIQRVEFDATLSRSEFEAFLDGLRRRLAGQDQTPAAPAPSGQGGIRFGAVGLRPAAGGPDPTAAAAPAPAAFGLDIEFDATSWILQEVASRQRLPLPEVEAIVGALSVAMHGSRQMVLPLVTLEAFDQYTTAHSLNVSVLAMGLAERFGRGPAEVRAIGIAGLLHDIGKTMVPRDVLLKPGRLTHAEQVVMNRHPEHGARLILRSDDGLDVAAIVAYEHHMRHDGGGYPKPAAPRVCHPASRLVHVCDVFDALRTSRPYRPAWSLRDTARHLVERSGTDFDPQFVRTFLSMIGAPADAADGVPASQPVAG